MHLKINVTIKMSIIEENWYLPGWYLKCCWAQTEYSQCYALPYCVWHHLSWCTFFLKFVPDSWIEINRCVIFELGFLNIFLYLTVEMYGHMLYLQHVYRGMSKFWKYRIILAAMPCVIIAKLKKCSNCLPVVLADEHLEHMS